jgi:predicted phage tail protein
LSTIVTYDLTKKPNTLTFGTVVINRIDNPFDPIGSKVTKTDLHGNTLDKYLDGYCLGANILASVNGNIIENPCDYLVRPNDNITYTTIVEGGGGGGVKQIVSLVAMIALTYFTFGAGSIVAGGWAAGGVAAGSFAAYAIGTAMFIAGSLLINSVLGQGASASMTGVNAIETESSTYSWSGIQTSRELNKPIPVLYGTHALGGTVINSRFYYNGYDDWIGTQLALCHGEIEEITSDKLKINDVEYSSYINPNDTSNGSYQQRVGTFDQSIMTGYGDSTYNNGNVSRRIKYNVPYTFMSESTNINFFRVHFEFPSGLYRLNTKTGDKLTRTVSIEVKYRKVGDTTWQYLREQRPFYATEYGYRIHTLSSKNAYVWSRSSTRVISTWDEQSEIQTPDTTRQVIDGYTYYDNLEFSSSSAKGLKKYFEPLDLSGNPMELGAGRYEFMVTRLSSDDADGDNYNVSTSHVRFLEEVNTTNINYGGVALLGIDLKATDQLSNSRPNFVTVCTRKPLKLNGQYKDSTNPAWICLDILTNKHYGMGLDFSEIDLVTFNRWASFCNGGIANTFTLTDSITNTIDGLDVSGNYLILPAISLPVNESISGLSQMVASNSTFIGTGYYYIGDTKQLISLSVNDISSISYMYVVDHTTLADGYYYYVAFNYALEPDTYLTYDFVFKDSVFVESPKLEFNGLFDTSSDIWTALQDTAQVGRGQVILRGNKYSCIYDDVKIVKGLFNAANSKNVTVQYLSNADIASEIEIQFSDSNIWYEMNSISVQDIDAMASGVTSNKTTKQVKGITTEEGALTFGKYLLASSKFLRRVITLDADIESITQTVGDLVAIQTDVTQYGVGGLVLQKIGNAVVLDCMVSLEYGKEYTLKIKNKDTDAILDYTFTPTAAAQASYTFDDSNGLTLGVLKFSDFDLVINNEYPTGVETNTILITNGADIIAEDRYSFGLKGSDSILCTILDIDRSGDLTRKITAIEYNESILDFDYDNDMLQRVDPVGKIRNVISNFKIKDSLYKTQRGDVGISFDFWWDSQASGLYNIYIESNGDKTYIGTNITRTNFTWESSGVNSGDVITFYIEDSLQSGTLVSNTYTVVGFLAPPPDVDVFVVNGKPNDTKTLIFDILNKPLDLAGYIIKYQVGDSLNWLTASPIHQGILTTSPYKADITKVQGEYSLLIKAVDTMGNESVNVKFIKFNQGESLIDNLVYEKDFHAEGFVGEIFGGVVQGNNDLLANGSSDLMYYLTNNNYPIYQFNNAELFYQGTYEAMHFIGSFTPDGGGLALIEYAGTGSPIIEYREYFPNPMYTNNDYLFYTSLEQMYQVGEWNLYTGGFNVKAFSTYEIRIRYAEGTVRPSITKLKVLIDIEDIDESYEDVVIDTIGTLVTPKYITNLKNVVATLQTSVGSTAIRVEVVNKTSSNALLKCFDIDNNPVIGLVDIRLKGYINE